MHLFMVPSLCCFSRFFSPLTEFTGTASCEQRGHNWVLQLGWGKNAGVLTSTKGRATLVSQAAAVGQSVVSQRWLPGVYPGGQEGKHRQGNAESQSSQQHAALEKRYRSCHSRPPSSLQIAGEGKPTSKKPMISSACSYRAACSGTVTVLVFSGHCTTRHRSGALGSPPLPCIHHSQWDVSDYRKRWVHLSLRSCAPTPGIRRWNRIF